MGVERTRRSGRHGLALGLVLWGLSAWACNNLLGIDEGRLSCVHTSDCPKSQICLYERCSAECKQDVDCPDGRRCVQTLEDGPRCVASSSLECERDSQCQAGSRCQAGSCSFPCDSDDDCVDGQRCSDHFCGGGEMGSGGSAGSSGNSTTGGGTSPGGGAGAGSGGTGTQECEEGDTRCPLAADASREVCKGGRWEPAEACGAGTLCDSARKATCSPIVDECLGQQSGAATCDGNERIVCGEDLVSVEMEECVSAAHCNQATGPNCAICLENEYRCDGDVLSECNASHTGFDEVTTCVDEPCNAILGECTTRVCNAGEYTCDATNNTLQHCNEDGNGFDEEVECGDGICDAEHGECDICEPGATLGCEDDENKTVCDDTGQDTISVSCASEDPDTPVCLGDGLCRACLPSSGECVDLFSLRTCNAQGAWGAAQTCTDQACIGDQCTGECAPGTQVCADQTSVKVCGDDGSYESPEPCDGQACSGAGCTGECKPEDTQCANKFSLQTCSSQGSWSTPQTCSGQACSGGACTGVCVPESTTCEDSQRIRTCSDSGQWGNPVACNNQACGGNPAKCQGQCSPGSTRCLDGLTLQTCSNSGTYTNTDCGGANQACRETSSGSGVFECGGTCAPGSERCSSNRVQTCNGQGAWSNTQTCTGQTCVLSSGDAACQGICAPGYQRCNGNNVQNCSATGNYSGTASNCTTSNKTCMESGTTASCGGECAPNQTTCTNGDAYHCVSGSWSVLQNCSSPDQICQGGACVANDPYPLGEDNTAGFSMHSRSSRMGSGG